MRSVLLAGVVLALAPCAGRADEVDTAVAEARALLDKDKPAAALDRLARLDPADPRVALASGVAQYHAGNAPRAVELLALALPKLEKGSLQRREAVQVLGLSHYLAGHLALALPFLEETRAWAADNLELHHVLATVYIQLQQPDQARACVAHNFGVEPDSAAGHLLAAQMMIRLEQEGLAEAELQKAIQKDPRLPQAHFLLGQIALFRGKLDESVDLTRKELLQNPGNAMAWSQLGDAYVRRQSWDEAAAALQRSIWINPYYSAPYILLGRTYMKKGQPATAEGMLRRALEYDPNNKSAHYLLGQLLQQMGREDEARVELETAARLQGQGR